MCVMSEGTRIGEFKENVEFNPVVATDQGNTEDFKPTKIGELSEFEKSLMGSEAQPTITKKTTETVIPKVSVRAQLEASADSSDFQAQMNSMLMDYQEGDVVTGVVRHVEKSGVLVDMGYKSDGFISNAEFSNDPDITPASLGLKPGDDIRAYIEKLESREGYTILSRKRAEYEDAWSSLISLAKSRGSLEVKITSKVQGGLVASYMGIKGFIPASHILKEPEDTLDGWIGQTIEAGVIQADRKRRKVVFAKRTAKQKANREAAQKLLESLEMGQVRQGKVTSIKDFGVFVDLGGAEGLVHISELSWVRVANPSELVTVGQDVSVFVLGVDKENGKISLGMKQLQPDPWVNVKERYNVGDLVTGVVTRILTFGAFVKIEANLEGLIHISELSNKRVLRVEDIVSVGQTVEAKIIKIIPEDQKIGLSLRFNTEAKSQAPEAEAEATATA